MPESCPLVERHCRPCEGGVEKLDPSAAEKLLAEVPDWELDAPAGIIRRKYKFRDFRSALAFLNSVGELAEQEQHHPDLHLTGYRHLKVELKTHAIDGLSENDFILAARINALSTD